MTGPVALITEAQAQKAVMDLFRLHGWEVEKTEEDRFRGLQGLPDLLCTSQHGMQMWIEMKRPASSRNPRGRVRKAQKERLIRWRRKGVPCCVLDGVPASCTKYSLHESIGWSTTVTLKWCDTHMAEYTWWPA